VKRTTVVFTFFVLAAALLSTLVLSESASPAVPIPTGTLAGTVLDSTGKPVAGATVTIQASDGTQPNATHTDASGHFAFARFETGQYDLQAYSKGLYSDWSKRVMIRSRKTTTITLKLAPPATITVIAK
jgi:protocatechuate 3,4-dioxygenase beta subunit